MEAIDWDAALEDALKSELGEPTEQTREKWFFQGTASSKAQAESRSFHYTPGTGKFNDWSAGAHGRGVRQFYERVLGISWGEGMARLRSLGYEVGKGAGKEPTDEERARFERMRQERQAKQERERAKGEADRKRMRAFARRLWGESDAIVDNARHPFRLWAAKHNVLHPHATPPPCLRWHKKRGLILAGAVRLDELRAAYPDWPVEVVAVAAVAIDRDGAKRMAFGDGTRDKTSYAQMREGVVLLGDPESGRVVLVEGIKDALAIYTHRPEPCAVVASISTVRGLANRAGFIDYLIGREALIVPDTDEGKVGRDGKLRQAGQMAAEALAGKLYQMSGRRIDSRIVLGEREGTDPGDWAQAQFMPEIDADRLAHERARLVALGVQACEADRAVIHGLKGGAHSAAKAEPMHEAVEAKEAHTGAEIKAEPAQVADAEMRDEAVGKLMADGIDEAEAVEDVDVGWGAVFGQVYESADCEDCGGFVIAGRACLACGAEWDARSCTDCGRELEPGAWSRYYCAACAERRNRRARSPASQRALDRLRAGVT